MQLHKPARNTGRVLAMAVPVVLFPGMAHAHSGGLEVYATIVAIGQFVAGPAVIIFARWFKGRRPAYLAGFFLGVVCSWVFFLAGRPFGMAGETYDRLTENVTLLAPGALSLLAFYVQMFGTPLAAMAVVWAAYALRGKYRRNN